MPGFTHADLARLFSYRPPTDAQSELYDTIQRKAYDLARYLLEVTPSSAEQTLAIRSLESAVMHAVSSIARDGGPTNTVAQAHESPLCGHAWSHGDAPQVCGLLKGHSGPHHALKTGETA